MKKYFGFFIVFVLSLWTIKPLFAPGFFPMHDNTQVARVFEMGKALGDGMFPVRWASDLGYGYGYPIFNFYAPFAYYIGGILTLFNLDALVSTKIMIGIGMMLAGIFMYLLARSVWNEIGGIISALFYMYAPYHAVNMYVRGAVSELYAYAFIPLVFYSLWKTKAAVQLKYIFLGAGAYAGIILSHNLTAMMVTPFILFTILLLIYKNKKKAAIFLLIIPILGIGLSAFYWLPALLEMKYTNVLSQIGGGADFRDHFVCVSQLWNGQWGFGGSTSGCIDGMSFKIGKLHVLGVITLILLMIHHQIKNSNNARFSDRRRVISLLLVGFFVSVVFMLEVSKYIWEAIPVMAYFQYPWRFLLLTSFFSSMLAGGIPLLFQTIEIINRRSWVANYISAFLLIGIVLYFNTKLFQPQRVVYNTLSDFTSEYALLWTASSISDEYLPKDVLLPKSFKDVPKASRQGEKININVENHNKLFTEYNNKLPQVEFIETNTEKMANTVSLISIGMLIVGIISTRKYNL